MSPWSSVITSDPNISRIFRGPDTPARGHRRRHDQLAGVGKCAVATAAATGGAAAVPAPPSAARRHAAGRQLSQTVQTVLGSTGPWLRAAPP
eukprot:355690-Chlamydomonas_euryale.AAC.10